MPTDAAESKPSRQAKRASSRAAAKGANRKRPPSKSETDSEETKGTVDLDGGKAPADQPPNGVLLTRDFDGNGKIVVNVVALGDVKASELEYICKKGLKALEDADI